MADKPRVFVASSSAGLATARKIQNELIDVASPTVWDKEDWQGKGTLEQLMNILNKYQFGVFVLRPDDTAEIKGETKKITRDNVLLELGLFVGRHGREKSFIVSENDNDLRIASDLLGINFGLFTADSTEELAVACNKIREKISDIWKAEAQQRAADSDSEINPLTYEAGMLYRILNAASSPHYKPIDYSYLMKPYTPGDDQSLSRIAEVRMVAERLFYYYMLADLRKAQQRSQRLRVYFAYYLGDGAPLPGSEPFYCFGRNELGTLFKGEFVIGISTSEGVDDARWNSGLPLGGYTEGIFSKALSNAAAAFRELTQLPIDDTDKPPKEYKHLNFKVADERAVYSVPVLLSEKKGEESVAPIGVLSISGSHPQMITDDIKKRAEHLAILLGFIFYLHAKQNRDEPSVDANVGVTSFPVGFRENTNTDFLRRAVSLRREIAKHFEEYFIREKVHRLERNELFYES